MTRLTDEARAIAEHYLTEAKFEQLRAPFPAEAIGSLPKAGRQLDFVGHGHVRDRLLRVDPSWTWEPMARDEHGMPLVEVRDGEAELWILLTVCGVTKPGVGVEPVNKSDLAKCLISDALRNAAMSFGVALDLWMREGGGEGETFKAEARGTTSRQSGGRVCVICDKPLTGEASKYGGGYAHKSCADERPFD